MSEDSDPWEMQRRADRFRFGWEEGGGTGHSRSLDRLGGLVIVNGIRCPANFNPTPEINHDFKGDVGVINTRQVAVLLLHGAEMYVAATGRRFTLQDLHLGDYRPLFKTNILEYIEQAQQLGGFKAKAADNYFPNYSGGDQHLWCRVGYDLIIYGRARAFSGMGEHTGGGTGGVRSPYQFFNPLPEYPVNVNFRGSDGTNRKVRMNARRVFPFIVNSHYHGINRERPTWPTQLKIGDDAVRIDARNVSIHWVGWDEERGALYNCICAGLYMELASLAGASRKGLLDPNMRNLYQSVSTCGHLQFYNPMDDLIAFGEWLAFYPDEQLNLVP